MKNTHIPVGAAIVFTVFTVIMLASFATLALSTANADLALTDRAMKAMEEYYSLDKEGQKWLSQLEEGEGGIFEAEGDASTLYVEAKKENGITEVTEYRSIPEINGEYDQNIFELWDGK